MIITSDNASLRGDLTAAQYGIAAAGSAAEKQAFLDQYLGKGAVVSTGGSAYQKPREVNLGSFEVSQAENGFILRYFNALTNGCKVYAAKDAEELQQLFTAALVTERLKG